MIVRKIFGYNIDTHVELKMFWEIVHPEDVNELRATWGRIEKTMVPHEGTFRILLKDGTIKFIREKATFTTDSNGKLLITRGTVQDITEIEESNIQLENNQIQ